MNPSNPLYDEHPHFADLCTATGLLFLAFANFENALTGMLKLHLARSISEDEDSVVSIPLAAAVYGGGLRFKASRDAVKRIALAERADDQKLEFIKSLFEQVANIEFLRDLLAHQTLSAHNKKSDGVWQSALYFATKGASTVTTYEFTTAMVRQAALDIFLATYKLGPMDFKAKLTESFFHDISPVPWRYKPSELKTRHQKIGLFVPGSFPPPPA